MSSQKLTYNEDVAEFASVHKRSTEDKVRSDFPLKVRLFDELLQTEQFSMTKLDSLLEVTRAVGQTFNTIGYDEA